VTLKAKFIFLQCIDFIPHLTLCTSQVLLSLFTAVHFDQWFISAKWGANSYQVVQESRKEAVLFACFNTKIPVDPPLASPAIASSDNTGYLLAW